MRKQWSDKFKIEIICFMSSGFKCQPPYKTKNIVRLHC